MTTQDPLTLWLNAATRSCEEVLRSLTEAELEETGTHPPGRDVSSENDVSIANEAALSGAYIPIDSEEHTYLIALLTTVATQYQLTRALLGGAAVSESPLYVRDAMGEISNMIAGGTKSRLSRVVGYDLTLGLPMFILGQYLETSTARTRISRQGLLIGSEPAYLVVIQQQVSGEAVRRRLVERQLRDSEERQRAIIEAAPDAVVTASMDGKILSFNSAAESNFTVSAGETLGRELTRFLHVPFTIGAEPKQHGEGKGIRPDGSEFPVDVSASTFRFRETTQVALIVRDITQREVARKALEEANQRLVDISHAAGKAEVAADVLHNVGNVLNSVNTTSTLLTEKLKKSKTTRLNQVVGLLESQADNLVQFFSKNPKGTKVVPFLSVLSKELAQENASFLEELTSLQKHIDHIKRVIMTQQSVASAAGMTDEVDIDELVEDSLLHARMLVEAAGILVINECDTTPKLITDKNKVLQIIINLVKNACEAMGDAGPGPKTLHIRTMVGNGRVTLVVADSGEGIATENMERLFDHGFTTKKGGHGFGLHGCALQAKQLGGSLEAASDGPGKGATFRLELPMEPHGSVHPSRPSFPKLSKAPGEF